MASSRSADFTALAGALKGQVIEPGGDGWDDATLAWNLAAQQEPPVAVLAADAEDVAATLRFAGENGLRVAAQATGHGALQHPDLDDTILLRTGPLDRVEVDATGRRAHVGGGVPAIAVAQGTAEHGLTAVLGAATSVGVTGFTLGGGLGWLSRSKGLGCSSIRSAEVVLASGEIVHVDEDSDAELLWALRGGGGAYGVVTELELEIYEIGEFLAGGLMFDIEHAAGLYGIYRDWAADAPREVTSSIRLLTPPDVDAVPEPMRGRPLVTITAACSGDAAAAEELLAPLRNAAPAIVDSFDRISSAGLGAIHGDPEEPVPGLTGGRLIDELSPERFDAVIEAYSGSSVIQVDFRQLGGALAEPAAADGAQTQLRGEFATAMVAGVAPGGPRDDAQADLDRVLEALEPGAAERDFMNFHESPSDGSDLFDPDTLGRLRQVKARVDPGDVIRGGQEIKPAG